MKMIFAVIRPAKLESVKEALNEVGVTGLTVIGGSGATAADMAGVLALHRAAPFVFHIDFGFENNEQNRDSKVRNEKQNIGENFGL